MSSRVWVGSGVEDASFGRFGVQHGAAHRRSGGEVEVKAEFEVRVRGI